MEEVRNCPMCGRLIQGKCKEDDVYWECLCGWEEIESSFGLPDGEVGDRLRKKLREKLRERIREEEG